jgi:hypothetical protein
MPTPLLKPDAAGAALGVSPKGLLTVKERLWNLFKLDETQKRC